MQLVLDDKFRRRQRAAKSGRILLIARAVKSFPVVAFDQAEQRSRFARPRQCRKLVHRRDEESWQTAINGFVNAKNRQAAVA